MCKYRGNQCLAGVVDGRAVRYQTSNLRTGRVDEQDKIAIQVGITAMMMCEPNTQTREVFRMGHGWLGRVCMQCRPSCSIVKR